MGCNLCDDCSECRNEYCDSDDRPSIRGYDYSYDYDLEDDSSYDGFSSESVGDGDDAPRVIYCVECGSKALESWSYCRNCGAEIPEEIGDGEREGEAAIRTAVPVVRPSIPLADPCALPSVYDEDIPF